MITFAGLADLSPDLLRFEVEATEAARNRWPGWPEWVATFSGLRDAVRNAAAAGGMDPWAAQEIILRHLGDVFRNARVEHGRADGSRAGEGRGRKLTPGGGYPPEYVGRRETAPSRAFFGKIGTGGVRH
jgi:hypothetical protein